MNKTHTDKIALPSLGDVRVEQWAALAQAKVFFGHQSVGYNIIQGITDTVDSDDQIKLNIVETHAPAQCDRPVLAHAGIGRNTDPDSKIEGFREIMNAGLGDRLDIAFFKFCYVDIMRDSDPRRIFDAYAAAMEDLKRRYSTTRFLHVTVPLRSLRTGAKAGLKRAVKSLLGMPGVLDDNIVREQYNELLRKTYCQTEPVFDIALIESTRVDGTRCQVTRGAQKIPVMTPEYTDDGGHLNSKGRRKIAERLLITLARMINDPRPK